MVDIKIINVDLPYELKKGNARAFEEIYDFYYQHLFRFVLKMTKSNAFADDILQGVFTKIWETRAAIDPDQHFGAYIQKITLHHTLNFLKKAARDSYIRQQLAQEMKAAQAETSSHLDDKDAEN